MLWGQKDRLCHGYRIVGNLTSLSLFPHLENEDNVYLQELRRMEIMYVKFLAYNRYLINGRINSS